MARMLKIPYTGDSFKTYNFLLGGIDSFTYNTVLRRVAGNVEYIFYINSKKYLHLLKVHRYGKENPKFYINDWMLSPKNVFIDKGHFVDRYFHSMEDVANALRSLIGFSIDRGDLIDSGEYYQ